MKTLKWLTLLIGYPVVSFVFFLILFWGVPLAGFWILDKLHLFLIILLGGFLTSLLFGAVALGGGGFSLLVYNTVPHNWFSIVYISLWNLWFAGNNIYVMYQNFDDLFMSSSKGILLALGWVPLVVYFLFYLAMAPFALKIDHSIIPITSYVNFSPKKKIN